MAFFVSTKCAQCGEEFGLTQATMDTLRRSSAGFKCPWGHPLVFSQGESEADKLRKERDRLKQNTAYLEDRVREERGRRERAERSAIAMKGVATRIKNRVGRGVCPCCSKTFSDLERHMEAQHKDFVAAEIVPEGATVQ